MAYSATNYHSEVGAEFAKCVTAGSGGKLEIVTHPSGSLFKGNEIKRAVQTGQAPIGERLLSAHQNENPIFGVDSIPFLATSFDEAARMWDPPCRRSRRSSMIPTSSTCTRCPGRRRACTSRNR
ncbi:MAG: hypothetical protein R3E68_14835 [Burkholderiaceae bacterium]